MNKPLAFVFVAAALLISIIACNLPGALSPVSPTADLAGVVAATQTAMAVSQILTPSAGAPLGIVATPPTTIPGAPTPTQGAGATTPPNCTLKAKFLSETVPDNTQFAPGQPFIKTWTLQNIGACAWSPEFSLIFNRGEQMGGTSPSPIGQTVEPNGTIQIFLPQTAPTAPGEHQGFWLLQDLTGAKFGLGEDAATPIWTKINVVPGLPVSTTAAPGGIQNLGPATTTFTFTGKNAPFYLGESDETNFAIKDGALVLTAIEPTGDLWRVAERSGVDDFALEARFRTGSACSGRDGYGLLVRAPNQSDDIIDSGYVFGFNCEGQFRVYRMDNGGYTGIQSWSSSVTLHPGANQENVMLVKADGDRFQFYGNGVLLFEFFDPGYGQGLWGLMIGSGGTPNFQALVTQISLWDLP